MKRYLKNILSAILSFSVLFLNSFFVEAHNFNPIPYTFNELQPNLILLNESMDVTSNQAGEEIFISFQTELQVAVNISDRGYDGISYSYGVETTDNIGIISEGDGYRILIPNDAKAGDSYHIKLTLCDIGLQILCEPPFIYHTVSEIPPVEYEIFTINIADADNSGSSSNNAIIPEPEQETPAYVPLTDEEIHAMRVAEIESRQKKTVTKADGTTVTTEITGVYEIDTLDGSAVVTAKSDVLKAIGLTEEEISAGTNASIYMSGYLSKTDREVITAAIHNSGKTALIMLVSDMYTITKDGKITKLNSTPNPISLLFGLPKYAIDADKVYSVLCVQSDGSYVELKDIDDNPDTITIDTTVFGKYVIVY